MNPQTQYLNSYIDLYNQMKSILHYPRLDTVLMVEEFILKHTGEYKKKELWKNLPKKVMYQTFCVIIDYLLNSGKIAVDKNKVIGWIYDPELVRKYKDREDLSWRKN